MNWTNVDPDEDPAEAAVVGVAGAEAFCAWRGGRLPFSVEWEIAGRGKDGNLYPWGNKWDSNYLPTPGIRRLADIVDEYPRVGTRPNGRSIFGVEDMVGLAPEFVRSDEGYLIRNVLLSLEKRGPHTEEDYGLAVVSEPQKFQRGVFRCVYQ